MVSVLAIGPTVCGFKPGRGRRIFMAIKICGTPSFGGQVKPSAHVVRFYGILKIPAEYDRDTTSDKFDDISRHSLLRY
jgi:hypothetical protein